MIKTYFHHLGVILVIGILAVACSATLGTEPITISRLTTVTPALPTSTIEPQIVEVTRVVVDVVDGEESQPYATPSFPMMDVVPIQSRPEFIKAVGPVEYSIVESDFYHLKQPGIQGIRISGAMKNGFQSAICVKPFLRHLIEKGDYLLDLADMWERMTLLVDGETKEAYGSSGLGLPTWLSEQEQETQWIEGEDYCWRAPLDVGVHDVVFQFRQTSGEVHEYRWLFEIID